MSQTQPHQGRNAPDLMPFSLSSVRLYRLLLAASLLVPLAVFAAAAAWNHGEVWRENRETTVRTAAIMHEHARKVFDSVELALALVDDRVRGLSWDEIARPEISAFLRDLKAPLEQAVSIWLTDPNGIVRAGSQAWDPSLGIGEREWFQVQREADRGVYVSSAFMGKATRVASFAVSRRRSSPDGRFDGIIHVALSPEYFSRFMAEAAPRGANGAGIVRRDGEILARHPYRWPNPRLDSSTAIMRAIAAHPSRGETEGLSQADQRDRTYAYRQVAPYPVFVVFGVDVAQVRAQWLKNVAAYGAVAAVSALVLALVSWLALKRAEAEQQALVRLQAESEQRLAAEQRLLQAQKMESLGQLTGGVAHDFNNLLAVIIGNLDLVRRRVHTDERSRRLLDTAMQGAQRGAALTQRLLAFARRQELSPQPVDVEALVEGMRDLLTRSLGANTRLEVLFGPDLPPVMADPAQLEMALLNLVVNARDAMPQGGVVTISAGSARLDSAQIPALRQGDYVRIRVADTGAGMDAATLARAVEPFFTTKGVGKGTGLGLSMIHGFAVQSGGMLRLESEPGGGTVAELWLPQGAAVQRADETERPAVTHRDCSVLLVEDDPLVMAGTVAMLEDLGHRVTAAASASEALGRLAADPTLDLVITDHAMPGMTGLELAERIRAAYPDLPIILASGHGEAAAGFMLDVLRLPKPFMREELAAAIASVLTPTCEPVRSVQA